MSALPPKADMGAAPLLDVRLVPIADIAWASLTAALLVPTPGRERDEKVDPFPTRTQSDCPPCISTMRFDMASPSPVPSFLRIFGLSAC